MKTRLGFVSNSSSASFTLVTTEAAHREAIAKLTKAQADVIEQIAGHKTFETSVVVVACYYGDDGKTHNQIKHWKNLDNIPVEHSFERTNDPSLSEVIHA